MKRVYYVSPAVVMATEIYTCDKILHTHTHTSACKMRSDKISRREVGDFIVQMSAAYFK